MDPCPRPKVADKDNVPLDELSPSEACLADDMSRKTAAGGNNFGRSNRRHCERSEAIHLTTERKNGLLRRGACHRARIRATRWLLAMTSAA
jgi:hypothetical protein